MTSRSQMSLILCLIGSERPELFGLELGKIAAFELVYTLASTNISQSAPNLVRNVYDNKISDEFDYGSNRTKAGGAIRP